jgi:hypothetical protein
VSNRKVEDGPTAPSLPPSTPGEAEAGSAIADVRVLVRLMLAGADETLHGSRLTNEAAIDALARRLIEAARGTDGRTRTAVMALRDLVWRVDTARVLIAPKLQEIGSGELADLLATDDIHALLRDIA